jgi:hypothetical protein
MPPLKAIPSASYLAAKEVAGAISGARLVMVTAIREIYGIAGDINNFLDKHIADLKTSDNPTVTRTGDVMEAAKIGFGIGYIIPVVIIATGQLLLGNPLDTGITILKAATLTNPNALTCAAIGAIYFGWNALSDEERNKIISKLTKGLNLGVELIKSAIRFVIDKIKIFFNSDNLKEIKVFVASAAMAFGRSLGDITKKVTDIVSDSLSTIKKTTSHASDTFVDIASDAYDAVKKSFKKEPVRSKKPKSSSNPSPSPKKPARKRTLKTFK